MANPRMTRLRTQALIRAETDIGQALRAVEKETGLSVLYVRVLVVGDGSFQVDITMGAPRG